MNKHCAQIAVCTAFLCMVTGCAWWYETPARQSAGSDPGSAFSITLHCESEEVVRAQQQSRVDAWLAMDPTAVDWMPETAPEAVEVDEAWVDDECDDLLDIMREGSLELNADARYERAGRRL